MLSLWRKNIERQVYGLCSPLKNMNKNEVFQFVNKLNNLDISTMIFRETVFDIISFGKANKIHLATTASLERIKHVLTEYNLENAPDEKDTLKFTVNNDTCYIHSIFKMSYDDFVKKMVATDLTFNSLLMKPDGQIYDMYNGLEDLKNKRLRFVDSFNEKNKTRLVLNCIRYIYKNGFTYDDAVKKYIEECLPSFTKSEKTNALFYLVEYINKEAKNADMELLLNDAFFKTDKTPNIDVSNYESTIASIGKEKYIYLLLILANININKTRFSTLIDAEEFNDIKESFALNLCDEMTYYDLKDRRGYDYLANIVILQKEYAKLTKSEYIEPIFHKETVFDMIEQSESSSVFTDEYILEEECCVEKIQLPRQDTFGIAAEASPAQSVEFDFSSLFKEDNTEENSDNETFNIELQSTELDDETEITETTNQASSLIDAEIVDDGHINGEQNHDVLENVSEVQVETGEAKLHDSEFVSSELSNDTVEETSVFDVDALFATDNKNADTEKTFEHILEDATVETESDENETNNVKEKNTNSIPEDDDISSILNMSDDRNNTPSTKKRNINPRFKNKTKESPKHDTKEKVSDVTTTPVVDVEQQKIKEETVQSFTTNEDTVPVTPVLFDTPSFANNTPDVSDTVVPNIVPESKQTVENNDDFENLFSSKVSDGEDTAVSTETFIDTVPVADTFAQPVEKAKEENTTKTREERKSSIIDDIFEEEVKTPEISLSPEFDVLVSQVAEEGSKMPNDQIVQRQTVSETMMTEIEPETSTDEAPVNFDISEKDLEEILAELNGKKKNSFLDDDSSGSDDIEDVTASFASSNFSFQPQSTSYAPAQQSSSDDDFFKSLNDDFTEIIGGNG